MTRVFLCNSCGAPIDAPWSDLVITCGHCGVDNYPGRPDGPVPPRVPVDGRPRLNLGGRTWVLERKLAEGDSSDVYAGRWVVRLGERAVIKVQAAESDGDLLRGEHQLLSRLRQSRASGAEHFVTRLPRPVALGSHEGRVATVWGWSPGFVHSLEQVGEVHPDGVPGEVVVWLLKRLLELLGFVHESGYAHGAITPAHVLVHPRDHGAMLVGWTLAGPLGTHRPGFPSAWSKLAGSGERTAREDIRMACSTVRAIAGWHLKDAIAPGPIARVITRGEQGEDDAWALSEALVEASKQVYGPPAYHPLPMPGWEA